MDFTLEPLPFAEDALEPHIGSRTVNIHYHKHHKGYLDKLDKALENDELSLNYQPVVSADSGGVVRRCSIT